jgi:hypothetical protein
MWWRGLVGLGVREPFMVQAAKRKLKDDQQKSPHTLSTQGDPQVAVVILSLSPHEQPYLFNLMTGQSSCYYKRHRYLLIQTHISSFISPFLVIFVLSSSPSSSHQRYLFVFV